MATRASRFPQEPRVANLMLLQWHRMNATFARALPPSDFPVRGSARDKLAFAAKRATQVAAELSPRAPVFRLLDSSLELRAYEQPEAKLEFCDDRETLLSCGVALEFLQLILKHHGCMGRIKYFPAFDEPHLVARIQTANGSERRLVDSRLFAALNSSSSHALKPAELAVSEITMDLLMHAGARERSWIEFACSTASQERLRGLAATSNRLRVASVRVMSREDVFPTNLGRSAGGWLLNRVALWRTPQLAVRIDSLEATHSAKSDVGEFGDSAAMFAVVKTKTNEKHGWVAAGQTIGRSQLQALALGLGCELKLEALRCPQLRAGLRHDFDHKGFVQAILCFQSHTRIATTPRMQSSHGLPPHESIRLVDR